MDYEKKYNEALERAKEMCALPTDKATMEYIFPELRESEDEKIRQTLIDMVKRETGFTGFPSQGQVLAYLEKQKEPKQTDLPAGFYYIDLNGNRYYSKEFRYGDMKLKVGEQKPVESISQLTVRGKGVYKICPRCKERMVRDDSKVYTSMPPQYGYVCPKCGEMEFDTVMYDNPEMVVQKPSWSEEDELMRKRCIADLGYLIAYEPQYKERYDAQIDWLKSRLPLFKPSEEDKRILKGIIGKIDHDQTYGVSKDEMLNFLKRL